MKIVATVSLALAFGILALAAPVYAHHSFAAQYDAEKIVTLTGKVTKIEWMNPHVYFYIDVTAADGAVTPWELEIAGGPNSLIRQGWTRDSLKIDDVVNVEGWLARDGTQLASARSVILASSGKKLFSGTNPGN
jgi:Family of unknown function (DUF6152)